MYLDSFASECMKHEIGGKKLDSYYQMNSIFNFSCPSCFVPYLFTPLLQICYSIFCASFHNTALFIDVLKWIKVPTYIIHDIQQKYF